MDDGALTNEGWAVFQNPNLLSIIAGFSPHHLRLRLVSSHWNQGVINSHCNRDCSCQQCICESSFNQFPMKRQVLPWISKWKFVIDSSTPSALLSEMVLHKYSSAVAPIMSCAVEIGDKNVHEAHAVSSSSDMENVTELEIVSQGLSAESRSQFITILSNLQYLERLKINSMHFDDRSDDSQGDFHRLIQSFPNLKSCVASFCGLEEGLSVFASSPSVSNLEQLEVLDNYLPYDQPRVCHVIASSPFLTNLTALNLYGAPIDDAGIIAMCQSQYLTNLKTLNVAHGNLTGASIHAMVKSQYLKNIESLNVTGNPISGPAMASLLLSASKQDAPFSKLKELIASDSHALGPEFIEEVDALFTHDMVLPQRQNDMRLCIGSRFRFDEEVIEALTKIPLMTCVNQLEIICSTESGISVLFNPLSYFTSLQVLKIWSPKMTSQTVADLANSPLSSQIHTLVFALLDGGDEEHLNDQCCEVLAESPFLGQLKALSLSQPGLSVSVGLIALLSSPNLSSLTRLDCDLFVFRSYSPEECMFEAEAAEHIIELLTTSAARIEYLKFPSSVFAASVRNLVKERITAISDCIE